MQTNSAPYRFFVRLKIYVLLLNLSTPINLLTLEGLLVLWECCMYLIGNMLPARLTPPPPRPPVSSSNPLPSLSTCTTSHQPNRPPPFRLQPITSRRNPPVLADTKELMSFMKKVKSNNNWIPRCVSLRALIYLIVGWGRCQVEALSSHIGRTSRCQKIEFGGVCFVVDGMYLLLRNIY